VARVDVVDTESRQPIARAVGEWPQVIPATTELPQTEAPQIMLRAHLLGPFRVTLNDGLVENWPSGRGRAILKYLLTHRQSPVLREVLMDCFWPEGSPEAARNNLNVAIHGLRQAFRTLADPPVVIYKQGAYLINPDISVWLDVDHFEQHIQSGQRLEAAGQLAAAAAAYERGIELYADDFLIDDPNEEWPVLNRERLRVLYFEALDHLSQIYFHQGQYTMCATLCQRLLARDSCREDAHCRLMRCYCRQGQHPLALRQYQLCAKELQTHLNLEPATSTTELYERIQQREVV
jgi:DNA-binding SARP family transcriptional activator